MWLHLNGGYKPVLFIYLSSTNTFWQEAGSCFSLLLKTLLSNSDLGKFRDWRLINFSDHIIQSLLCLWVARSRSPRVNKQLISLQCNISSYLIISVWTYTNPTVTVSDHLSVLAMDHLAFTRDTHIQIRNAWCSVITQHPLCHLQPSPILTSAAVPKMQKQGKSGFGGWEKRIRWQDGQGPEAHKSLQCANSI